MGIPRHGPWLKWLAGGVVAGMALLGVLAYAMTTTGQPALLLHLSHHGGGRRYPEDGYARAAGLQRVPRAAQSAGQAAVQSSGRPARLGNITGKDVPHPVSLHTRDVVNANCKACHAQTNVNVASMDAKPYCVDCHRNVAHMRMRPISTRTVAYE